MFKELAPLLRQRSVLLSVTRLEDDNIRVNVFPKKLSDGENEALTTPMSVSGTAEELDAHLPSALIEYVGMHLGLSSTLQTAKEQMEAAAKKAKDEAKSKMTAKPAPAKPGATCTPAGSHPSENPSAENVAPAATKPAEPKKPGAPKTASLFDFSASSTVASAPGEQEAADEEDEIMAEIGDESTRDGDDIAA